MSTESQDGRDVAFLIGELARTARGVAPDDLSTLAKMHGWCEELAEAIRPDGTEPCAATFAIVGTVTGKLEALILGEIDDPAQAMDVVVDSIGALAAPEAAASEAVRPSDAEVAAKLDQVFAEAEDSAAETDGSPGEVTAADPGTEMTADAPVAEKTQEPSPSLGPPPYESEPLIIAEKELEFIAGFVEEAQEHIESIEGAVLEVEKSPQDSEKIDDLFRPFHTIKGMAGFLNLRDVNCVAHECETLLDQGRKGERSITPDLIDLILETVDILKVQVGAIASYVANPDGQPVTQPPVSEVIGKLRAAAQHREPAREPTSATESAAAAADSPDAPAAPAPAPAAEATPQAEPPAPASSPQPVPGAQATPAPVSPVESAKPAGSQTAPTAAERGRTTVGDQSVRIETAKLDALVDMVGELVIAQTLVGANPKIIGDPKLSKDVGQVAKIVRDVQEVAMAMRMIPIGATFHRMARLVRDVSRKAGKKVELTIAGEDTELDKNVIQQIGDPLVHMVRNAVDHGVESPEERIAEGKREVGHIHLSASHQGGNIVIQIRDDGKGLDRERLIAKAVERGAIQPGEELTDEQANALVFAPGLSTAATVTDISGRGVGMDVVKRNIEQLRGRVEITSEKGQGSTFTIRLPLTLAIIDGMVVGIAGGRFIVPTITIEQALRPVSDQITTVQQEGEVLMVRGRLIPLIQLGQIFNLTGRIDPCEAMVLIAHCEGRQIGLVVEELIGQQQVVIKSLGERFKALQGISGAAILGDGRVGLILETTGIAAVHAEWRPANQGGRTPAGQVCGNIADPAPASETSSEIREQDEPGPAGVGSTVLSAAT